MPTFKDDSSLDHLEKVISIERNQKGRKQQSSSCGSGERKREGPASAPALPIVKAKAFPELVIGKRKMPDPNDEILRFAGVRTLIVCTCSSPCGCRP